MKTTDDDRLRRAADYDLFFLRLRQGRLAEAFSQTGKKSFAKKYAAALAESYGLSPQSAAQLTRYLKKACSRAAPVSRVGDFLREESLGAPVYDFSLRVLQRCNAPEPDGLFAPDLFSGERATRLKTALRLIAIREQIYVDVQHAGELFAVTREAAEAQYAADKDLGAQLLVLGARIAVAKRDHAGALALCDRLLSGRSALPAAEACALIAAYALLEQGDIPAARSRIRRVRVRPQNLDARLLRLTVAVAAGDFEPAKLRSFAGRASYPYCARSLREQSESILVQMNAKKR